MPLVTVTNNFGNINLLLDVTEPESVHISLRVVLMCQQMITFTEIIVTEVNSAHGKGAMHCLFEPCLS